MKLARLAIPDVVEIVPPRHGDSRGYFSETYRDDWFVANIANARFVQDNQSLSVDAGVVRGLHFQSEPFAQGKLVRCIAGAIFDVVVDLRHGSPTFGKWVSAILSADLGNQVWAPAGFAHGFCTLGPNTQVCYKVTSHYSRDHDRGVLWNDPAIGIAWPDVADGKLISERDGKQPLLADLPVYFRYAGQER